MDNYRFYSFVAGLYLSPLQCGLQTAHAVSEMYAHHVNLSGPMSKRMRVYDEWAQSNKTIVILNALNSKGVIDVHKALMPFAPMYDLPLAIFNEDEQSLNGAATACGMVLPKKYFDVEFIRPDSTAPAGSPASMMRYTHTEKDDDGVETGGSFTYHEGNPEFELVHIIKGYRLA